MDNQGKSSGEGQANVTSDVVARPAIVLGTDINIVAQIAPAQLNRFAQIDTPTRTLEDRSLENRSIDIKNDRGEIVDK